MHYHVALDCTHQTVNCLLLLPLEWALLNGEDERFTVTISNGVPINTATGAMVVSRDCSKRLIRIING